MCLTGRSRLRWGARLRSVGTFAEERGIGARPRLSPRNAHWLAPFLPLSYTKVWQPLGVRGMNYISVSLRGARPARLPLFDPRSAYYHAWFGVYAILGDPSPFGFRDGQPIPDALIPLLLADEAYWQEVMAGGPPCRPEVTFQSAAERLSLPNLTQQAFLFRGGIASRSVLGPRDAQSPRARRYFPLPPERDWSSIVAAHHPIEQRGFAVVWADRGRGVTFCVYGAGARFTDRHGVVHDHSRVVEPELLALLASVRLRPVRTHP
jgi:hypothetical protein